MSISRWTSILGFLLLPAIAQAAWAQRPAPHLGYVYPAGGRQGTTFRVTVGGQYLGGVEKAHLSGGGNRIKVIEKTQPLKPKEVAELRERIQKLRKEPKDAAVREEMAELRKKLDKFMKQRANPVLAETVMLEVTLTPDAEPGKRELRLSGRSGLSNPLVFQVGQLPEFREKESPDDWVPPDRNPPIPRMRPKSDAAGPEMDVTLPAVVNGQIMPGDVDRYRFAARKGQRLVVKVSARQLIPYLADAVPGWFQATAALADDQGKELAYDDDYRFHPDPVLFYKIPKDGRYVLEIKDALYRGREDFVYRVALGELPFVTGIFPRGGCAGRQVAVKLGGGNLAVSRMTVDLKGKIPGIIPLVVRNQELIANPVPFAVDTLPEGLELEPNDAPAGAQVIAPPIIVNGRIGRPGDADVFRFEGRAGQRIVAEVVARRLDSPLDSLLKLTDAAGRQLALSDDCEDLGDGLSTHHADSLIAAALPADGAYFLHLSDTQRHGGAAYSYRLRVGPPQPDFSLRVVPSGINVPAGASAILTVYALRKDGYAGEISLTLKDAPKGYTLSGARVPAGRDRVRLTLTIPPSAPKDPVALTLKGRATIRGRLSLRPVVPADDMMQAFIYRHLVPAETLMAAAAGPPWIGKVLSRLTRDKNDAGENPIKIPAGGTVEVPLPGPRGPLRDQIRLTLNEPPDGIAIREVSSSRNGLILLLSADAGKVKPGFEGNLIVDAFLERTPDPGDEKSAANKRRIPLGVLPAIPFEVVGRQ